jgi:hypothetical protein
VKENNASSVSVNKNNQSVKENNASLVSVKENKNSSPTSSFGGYYRRRWNEKEKKAYILII